MRDSPSNEIKLAVEKAKEKFISAKFIQELFHLVELG